MGDPHVREGGAHAARLKTGSTSTTSWPEEVASGSSPMASSEAVAADNCCLPRPAGKVEAREAEGGDGRERARDGEPGPHSSGLEPGLGLPSRCRGPGERATRALGLGVRSLHAEGTVCVKSTRGEFRRSYINRAGPASPLRLPSPTI
ncbi:hypothetical protein PR202_ga20079 [Eleusine coracana subsp. coracana]|uniref:Uncharacterized protein n=1 Tax=Eleusine coracana subsp. coracana TaxID=191504 RepID=A0AAV5CX25_ELECO|nr:hypothetical protein PR202_ga20079 [Eleusine coracana subsp. coracana]